ALRHAQGEYFAVQDADLEYEPAQIESVVRRMQTEGWDVVFGSRFLKSNPTQYIMFYMGNKLVSRWISFLTRITITDAYTGTKIFKTELLRGFGLKANGFEIEAEMAVKTGILARQRRIRFLEIPIPYHPRTMGEGKKIGVFDGARAIWSALDYRLDSRRRKMR
ncbi:MAG: glycosyltransferase, partial [Elusimicrobiota bacterium]